MLKDIIQKQSFIIGLLAGIAVVSTTAFFITLPKAMQNSGNNAPAGIPLGDGNAAEEPASAINPDTWKTLAKELRLNTKKFNSCLDNSEMAGKVAADKKLGSQAGVSGTPATFINGELASGAIPYEDYTDRAGQTQPGLKNLVEKHLKDAGNNAILTETDNILGQKTAPVVLVEYSDFECPFCARHEVSMKKLQADFGDKIALVYRNFPLEFHPQAQKAAEASECAGAQGKFWEMHDKVFEAFAAQN